MAESGLDSKQVRLGLSGPAYIYMQHLGRFFSGSEKQKKE